MTQENEKLCEELNLKKQHMKEEVDSITAQNLQFIQETPSDLSQDWLREKNNELESLSTRLNNSLGLLNKQIDIAIERVKNGFASEEEVIKSYSDSIAQTIESIHKKQSEILSWVATHKTNTTITPEQTEKNLKEEIPVELIPAEKSAEKLAESPVELTQVEKPAEQPKDEKWENTQSMAYPTPEPEAEPEPEIFP